MLQAAAAADAVLRAACVVTLRRGSDDRNDLPLVVTAALVQIPEHDEFARQRTMDEGHLAVNTGDASSVVFGTADFSLELALRQPLTPASTAHA